MEKEKLKQINYDGISDKMTNLINEIQTKEQKQKINIIKERMKTFGVVCENDYGLAKLLKVYYPDIDTEIYFYNDYRVVTFIREKTSWQDNKLDVALKYY